MKICSNCRNQINDNVQFCPNCGNPVINQTNNNQNFSAGSANENQNLNYGNLNQPVNNNINRVNNYGNESMHGDNNNQFYDKNTTKNNKNLIIIIIAIVAVVAMAFGIYFIVSNSSSNNPQKKSEELTKNCETKIINLKNGDVLLEVSNNNNEPVYGETSKLEFFDENNQLIKSVNADVLLIPAKSKSYGRVFYSSIAEINYSTVKPKVKFGSAKGKTYSSEIKTEVITKNSYFFTIRVTNDSSTNIKLDHVAMLFYDNQNNIVGYSSSSLNPMLKSHETTSVDIYIPSDKNYKSINYSRYELYAVGIEK